MSGKHHQNNADDYDQWTKDSLIDRLRHLETELKNHASSSGSVSALPASSSSPAPQQPAPKRRKESGNIDPANYHTRYIALRIAYLGRNYGGFEYASSCLTPSIEEELFKALTKACLVFPKDNSTVDFTGMDYSKCGRTDRGVSAFGQVIALRVRSARPVLEVYRRKQLQKKLREKKQAAKTKAASSSSSSAVDPEALAAEAQAEVDAMEPPPFDPIKDELPYTKMLNRILPKDIRILAWCPHPPPDFSARFSCREREYRYFFTQPAFLPPRHTSITSDKGGEEGQPHAGWLNIEAMRDAARRFEGDRDFTNFCKVDPAKNILNYRRHIHESAIYEAEDMSSGFPHIAREAALTSVASDGTSTTPSTYPKVYYYRVRGSAFLWHQIRHMVSILFHVGQGLESPDLVDKLLDVEANPRRPVYAMADEVPLVLWNCKFAGEGGNSDEPGALNWVHVEDDVEPNKGGNAFGATDALWGLWRDRKMDEILANGLLRVTARDGMVKPQKKEGATTGSSQPAATTIRGEYSTKKFAGGNSARAMGKYVPVMAMERMESPQEQNDKYARRKGFANHEGLLEHKRALWDSKNGDADEVMDEGGDVNLAA